VVDVSIAAVAIVLLLPVFVLAAVLIWLESEGPVFFRQRRVGLNAKLFPMWKFRSMRSDAAVDPHIAVAEAWFAGQDSGNGYKRDDDPRVTRVGRFLRRTSLDELPQLFNVLVGDMSLVGPRPAIPYELEFYEPWHFERQQVLPGMTGLWQVSGRHLLSAGEMMRLDVRYVREWSLRLDFMILSRTLPALIGRYAAA
jgi:lipopolysaccharide/colanic/teichoic acid biosynthesis glycosyltransferase